MRLRRREAVMRVYLLRDCVDEAFYPVGGKIRWVLR